MTATSTLLALVLMINGVQVDLPAPAYMVGDNAFVPARAVFEKLGWNVEWRPEAKLLNVVVPGDRGYSMAIGSESYEHWAPIADHISGLPRLAAPRMIGDMVYVPVRAVTLITGAKADWDPRTLTVNLTVTPVGEPAVSDLGQILANPPAWAGRVVVIRGEYLGWHADPFGAATSQGPPVTRSDWTIRDAGGSLYCAATGVDHLNPIDDLGRRVSVTAVVQLADKGFPYLQPTAVERLTGLAGVECSVTTDRMTYAPGQAATLQMEVKNPGAESVTLHFFTGQTYDFQVLSPEGKLLWAWSQGRAFTQALSDRELKAGEKYTVTERWTVPADLPPGLYRVRGLVNRDVNSYPLTIAVQKG